jgi:hypothetical protein
MLQIALPRPGLWMQVGYEDRYYRFRNPCRPCRVCCCCSLVTFVVCLSLQKLYTELCTILYFKSHTCHHARVGGKWMGA